MATKRLTPIERFISEIPSDPRRAFDARQRQAGYTRVTVTVPTGHIETIKTIARFLRNGTVGPNTVESVMEWLEGGLRAEYEAFDDWVAAGEPD